MNDSWDEMRKAKEEAFFRKQNEEALKRIKSREEQDKPRLSPVTGQPMEQLSYMGVVIDRCKESGGIWLDAGELEQIVNASTHQNPETGESWMDSFFSYLKKK